MKYGYGLPTAGNISLDHYNYGRHKSFGVLGQQGLNYKQYRTLVEEYFEANEALISGFGERSDEIQKAQAMKKIKEGYLQTPMNYGSKLGLNCSSSFVLLSLTPNSLDDGNWNAPHPDGRKPFLKFHVEAQKTSRDKPLEPSFLVFPRKQKIPNPLVLVRPGETLAVEGASFVKAAAASATALAALYLF